MSRNWILVLALPAAAVAQTALTLPDAVRMALEKHPSLEAAAAQGKAAETRIGQAKAGMLPRVTYNESFQTSNNPVFAFGTLLTQRRFAESNFAIDSLNKPGFVNNFQSQLQVEQLLYDFGGLKAQVRAAELGKKMSDEEERALRLRRAVEVAGRYHGANLAAESIAVAEAAVKSAEADLARAEAVRDAGMSTDADVLTIRVHLAGRQEDLIRRKYDLDVALAALNEALGMPLDTAWQLATPLTVAPDPVAGADAELEARTSRPELRQAEIGFHVAESQRDAARAARLPQIVARGMFEADRGRFVTQAGANWFFGAGLRWNLFTGNADKRRVEEASHAMVAATARRKEAAAGIALHVRRARSAVLSAGERVKVADASIAQAEESLRIMRNRYQAGLATVSDLLRNETALLDARTRRLAAVHDQRVASIALEYAKGTLTGDSNVLQ
ncbi:MAG: TolC family protein [Bryobacteraceae bacterium]